MASQGSQVMMIQVIGVHIRGLRLLGHRAQVIMYGLHHPMVNLASQDITTLPRGDHIHGLNLHGHIHHGLLIG